MRMRLFIVLGKKKLQIPAAVNDIVDVNLGFIMMIENQIIAAYGPAVIFLFAHCFGYSGIFTQSGGKRCPDGWHIR